MANKKKTNEHVDWINKTYTGGIDAYTKNQNTRYADALKNNNTDLINRLQADAQRVGFTLNNPNNFNYGSFLSDYDKMYAKNPVNIEKAKEGYANAPDDATRNYYHNMANDERLASGYYAGTDGSGFTPILNLPEYKPFEYNDFNYDVNSDDIYKQYAEQFARQGQSASERALANTSAATGGMPSSYAAAANAQAQQEYAKKTADMIPVLEQNAYNRYQNERNFDYSDYLNKYNSDSSNAQARYGAMTGQRDFDYNKFLNKQNRSDTLTQRDIDNTYRQSQFDWTKDQDAIRNAISWANYGLSDRKFEYDKQQYELGKQEETDAKKAERDAMLADDTLRQIKEKPIVPESYPNTPYGMNQYIRDLEAQSVIPAEEENVRLWLADVAKAKNPYAWLNENVSYMTEDEYKRVITYMKDAGLLD